METASAHHETARALEASGDLEAAVGSYESALRLEPDLRAARRQLALLLARTGRARESRDLWYAEVRSGEDGTAWMNDTIVAAMDGGDLRLASELAAIFAGARWGSRWYPPSSGQGAAVPPPKYPPEAKLSISKLRHDAELFRSLRQSDRLDEEFDEVIAEYERIADRLSPLGINARVAMEPEDELRIGHVYNRIVHVSDAPRVGHALSPSWDRSAVQDRYLHQPPGVVVIDGFLSEPALVSLRRFCMESTVWSGNRYADGRLGSFFFAGFNCPLLIQVAEEIRDALPAVIGSRHPLRQLWGFKNSPHLPGNSTVHADFAAVNVNFWITPESANLDPNSGGLVVYDVGAPMSWDFGTYNESLDRIRDYLRERRARAVTIPYRANRAIIFNSDLFHATAKIHFRPEYENRRVNITMLFGDRERDDHHPDASAEAPLIRRQPAPSAWRSGAFRSRRP